MGIETYHCQCIDTVAEGLRDGLSHFSGPSRTALIYAQDSRGPIRIFDPQNLLRGHEPKFQELYLDSDVWRRSPTGGAAYGIPRKMETSRPGSPIAVPETYPLSVFTVCILTFLP